MLGVLSYENWGVSMFRAFLRSSISLSWGTKKMISNLKINMSPKKGGPCQKGKKNMIFQPSIFRVHASFRGWYSFDSPVLLWFVYFRGTWTSSNPEATRYFLGTVERGAVTKALIFGSIKGTILPSYIGITITCHYQDPLWTNQDFMECHTPLKTNIDIGKFQCFNREYIYKWLFIHLSC